MLTLRRPDDENLKGVVVLNKHKANYAKDDEQIYIRYTDGAHYVVDHEALAREEVEENQNAVYEVIRDQAAKGTPLGMSPRSTLPLWAVNIRGSDGESLSRTTKSNIVTELIFQGRVQNITGRPRDNGLWPVEHKQTNGTEDNYG